MDLPDIELPGSFVVLQGMAGDGLSNTIDSMPHVVPQSPNTPSVSFANQGGGPRRSALSVLQGSNAVDTGITEEDDMGFQHVGGGSVDRSPPRSRRRTQQQLPTSLEGTPSGSAAVELHPEDEAIRLWRRECRDRETVELVEVSDQWQGRPAVGALAGHRPSSHKGGQGNNQHTVGIESSIGSNKGGWWQRNGQLAVFASPSIHHHPSSSGGNGGMNGSDEDEEEEEDLEDVLVLGTLAPGTVVRGIEMVPTLPSVPGNGPSTAAAMAAADADLYTFLRIESPLSGFVLYSRGQYVHLAAGPPTAYADPAQWVWRITCPDGAYIRSGLELNSSHLTTVPYGVLVRVTRKTVNAMGLSRLRLVHRSVRGGGGSGSGGRAADALRSRRGGHTRGAPIQDVVLEGWISEALNPLSGQRGPIAQPLPFPIPVLYRVTLPDGAVIRSDVELSSSEVRVAPFGSILRVVGKGFSEHPMDQCIERMRIAGGGGWVSVRLNRPPPLDILIVELVGVDPDFDPDNPGRYHIMTQAEQEQYGVAGGAGVIMDGSIASTLSPDPSDSLSARHRHPMHRGSPTPPTSSRRIGGHRGSSAAGSVDGGGMHAVRAYHHSGSVGGSHHGGHGRAGRSSSSIAGGSVSSSAAPPSRGSAISTRKKHFGKGDVAEEKCLICLTEERTATMVHGETGHIACCLTCARILKARGDKCPVCRLPIDLVIQQFWA